MIVKLSKDCHFLHRAPWVVYCARAHKFIIVCFCSRFVIVSTLSCKTGHCHGSNTSTFRRGITPYSACCVPGFISSLRGITILRISSSINYFIGSCGRQPRSQGLSNAATPASRSLCIALGSRSGHWLWRTTTTAAHGLSTTPAASRREAAPTPHCDTASRFG